MTRIAFALSLAALLGACRCPVEPVASVVGTYAIAPIQLPGTTLSAPVDLESGTMTLTQHNYTICISRRIAGQPAHETCDSGTYELYANTVRFDTSHEFGVGIFGGDVFWMIAGKDGLSHAYGRGVVIRFTQESQ